MLGAGREAGTNEPFDVANLSCASGRAVVSPMTKACFEAEGKSAQPVKMAKIEIRNAIFFITVVPISAEFDRMLKLIWR